MDNFKYFHVEFKLLRPMLGTGTDTNIYHQHIIEKAKKLIEKAAKEGKKIKKSMEKYANSEISPEKELVELQSTLRASLALLKKPLEVPNTIDSVLELASELVQELESQTKDGKINRATVFLKNEKGFPIISTHMIVGNIKENLKILVNNGGDNLPVNTKKQTSEILALDIKAIDSFMVPNKDILRATSEDEVRNLPTPPCGRWAYEESTGRVLLERPLRGNTPMGETIAIAMSEVLPEETEFDTILRVRKDSPLSSKSTISKILDFGKSNGFGAWRGSGNMGAYLYRITELPDYKEEFEGGWM